MRIVSSLIFVIIILTYVRCQERMARSIEFGRKDLIKKFIKVPLDHFDKNENRTIDYTYLTKPSNDKSQPNAPIYLWLRGDFDDAYDYIANGSSLADQLAKETNGSVYTVIRRYWEYTTLDDILPHDKNYFKYLTTEQGLADYADVIKYLKSQPGHESSKVVLVGTYEGGREATWMRMKYPELVDAVVAANAALLAKKDFKEYYTVIHSAYKKYGTPDCLDKIGKKFHSIKQKLNTTKGIKQLIDEYHICDDIDFTLDVDRQHFWYRGVYRIDCIEITMETSSYIKYVCENMPSFKWERSSDQCFNCHVDYWKENFYFENFLYQRCSEFGQFRTTSLNIEPFVDLPLSYHLEICKIFFGIDEKTIDEGIAKTNEKFGGVTPNVTNVVFTYGELDASRLLGVTKNLSDTVVSFVIDGVGTYNVPYVTENDSKELIETRNAVKSLIKKWISA